MKKGLAKLQKLEDMLLIAAFVVMVIASFAQVINRNLIHAGISWFEELARYCMVYMALLAAEAGLRDGTQISITAITDRLKGVSARIVRTISKLIVIAFSATCFFYSFTILQTQMASGQISPGLKLPMVVPYFALPLSFGIITVVQIGMLIVILTNKQGETEEPA